MFSIAEFLKRRGPRSAAGALVLLWLAGSAPPGVAALLLVAAIAVAAWGLRG